MNFREAVQSRWKWIRGDDSVRGGEKSFGFCKFFFDVAQVFVRGIFFNRYDVVIVYEVGNFW